MPGSPSRVTRTSVLISPREASGTDHENRADPSTNDVVIFVIPMEKGHHYYFVYVFTLKGGRKGRTEHINNGWRNSGGIVDMNDNKKGNSEGNKHFSYCLLPKVDNIRDIKIA